MIHTQDKKVSLEQLVLDPNNYRLADEKEEKFISDEEAEKFEGDTLKRLEKQRLGELKDSIRNNGFLEMERIVVRLLGSKANLNEPDEKKKKYIVVEGNRRAAALKSLKEQSRSNDLSSELREKFNSINVISIEGEEEQIRLYSATLMGVRHVSGPKKWDGFQSAKLINDLYYDDGKNFTEIGEILGISNREAGRRFRGYQAFKQMKRDPVYKDKVEPRHYGLLLEFLSPSKEGKSWLDWDDSSFMFNEKDHLTRVYKAITPDENGELEVRNPADARKFLSLISTAYRADIEEGTSIHDLPNPEELIETGKSKRINSFISFIEKNSFNASEEDSLNELYAALAIRLGE